MKKGIKDNIRFIIAIISIAVVVGLAWIAIASLALPDANKMEKYFERDKADFVLIIEYFIQSDYSDIIIDKTNFKEGIISTGTNMRGKKIEDNAVVKAIERLFKRGYRKIGIYNNTIYFVKRIMFEEERGIAYSINGEDKPIVEFLTKLDPLSQDGWYYYEADYNEWRTR